jgi:hypothetical protein
MPNDKILGKHVEVNIVELIWGTEENPKNLSHDNQCTSRDWKLLPLEYKSSVVSTQNASWVKQLNLIFIHNKSWNILSHRPIGQPVLLHASGCWSKSERCKHTMN